MTRTAPDPPDDFGGPGSDTRGDEGHEYDRGDPRHPANADFLPPGFTVDDDLDDDRLIPTNDHDPGVDPERDFDEEAYNARLMREEADDDDTDTRTDVQRADDRAVERGED
jgi:hypothetical protein